MAGSRSPDSSISISSLLASCSLDSGKKSWSSASSIEYKEKLYDSATKALEAYIEDFEESLRSPMASTGKIGIHSATLSSSKDKGTAETNLRPKHFSRRRYVSRDPDLLSLTTDDLLGFPSDGSLPFSHASQWKPRTNLTNRCGPSLSPSHPAPSSPLTSSLNTRAILHPSHHHSHSPYLRKLGDDLKENRTNLRLDMDREKRAASYKNLNSLHLLKGSEEPKSYPRWLTSQKSDLAVSGISSIPEVRYPLWIKDYGLLESPNRPISKGPHKSLNVSVAREPFRGVRGSSSLDSLHPLLYDGHGREAVNSSSLGGKFYSEISDLDVLKHLHTPLKNHPSDSPLRQAEASEASQKAFPELPDNNGSPRTEDVLEAERSWEKIPYSFKSPVHIPCKDEISEEIAAPFTSHVGEDFKDRVKDESKASSFSGGNHHGPVEALKHMLFNLQTFQQNFAQVEEFHKVYTEADSKIQRGEQEIFPVNKSLQKALQHLARLKELVGDDSTKQDL